MWVVVEQAELKTKAKVKVDGKLEKKDNWNLFKILYIPILIYTSAFFK